MLLEEQISFKNTLHEKFYKEITKSSFYSYFLKRLNNHLHFNVESLKSQKWLLDKTALTAFDGQGHLFLRVPSSLEDIPTQLKW